MVLVFHESSSGVGMTSIPGFVLTGFLRIVVTTLPRGDGGVRSGCSCWDRAGEGALASLGLRCRFQSGTLLERS